MGWLAVRTVISGSRAALTVCTSRFAVLPPCSIVLKLPSNANIITISGCRLSTIEIESYLIMHAVVAEAAIIGAKDELTGHAVCAFVNLKPEFTHEEKYEAPLIKELALQVRKDIGHFAEPKKMMMISDLPKTRSGKV